MESIFSRIAKGEIPSYKVAENNKFYAFLDINPIQMGHTLVIPREQTDYIFDLDDQTLSEMIVFAKQVAKQIQTKLQCNRVAVAVIGLEVPHAHIHLIPINKESDLDFKKKLAPTQDELTQIANRLQ